jgi:hypothetical protein
VCVCLCVCVCGACVWWVLCVCVHTHWHARKTGAASPRAHAHSTPHATTRPGRHHTGTPANHAQLHNMRKFVPGTSRLRPAYFLAVDHSARTITWGARVRWRWRDLARVT